MPFPPVDELSARNHDDADDAPTAFYTEEERRFLLSVARQAIQAAIEEKPYTPEPLTAKLSEPRGVFTTLHIHGQLRGCVGQIIAIDPLVSTVAQTAVSAAFSDPRFLPLAAAELPNTQIEISVLSPLSRIKPEEIRTGVHGLLVTNGHQRGLLLPQVAPEWGWDAQTFLEQTCRKAGMPPEAWRDPGTEIYGFTVELFSE